MKTKTGSRVFVVIPQLDAPDAIMTLESRHLFTLHLNNKTVEDLESWISENAEYFYVPIEYLIESKVIADFIEETEEC